MTVLNQADALYLDGPAAAVFVGDEAKVWPQPAQLNFALIASAHAYGDATFYATAPAIDTTGADLVIVTQSTYMAYAASASDNFGNVYIRAIGATGGTGSTAISYCRGGNFGPGHIVRVYGADSYPAMQVAAFANSAASPLDQTNAAAGNRPGYITPSVGGALIVTTVMTSGTTFAIDSGFSILEAVPYGARNMGGALAWLVQTVPASVNPLWTGGQTAAIASFKPVGA